MMNHKVIISNEDNLIRVDVFLVDYLEDYSRSKIKKMITDGLIKVNGNVIKPSYLLKTNDLLDITINLEEKDLEPVNLDLEIIYEDDSLLVIYKPSGLIVHPSESVKEVTLVNHLLYHTKDLSLKGGADRPGIVHRLDKETSGLLVVAKSDLAYDSLVSQFQDRTLKREYLALVYHPFKETSGTIDAPITRDKIKMVVSPKGKEAITHFEVIRQNEQYSYLRCNLETGRTHQIRVHLDYINHPVVGDKVYSPKKNFKNYPHMLHATKIEFIHPSLNKLMSFTKNPPKEFLEVLSKVGLGE